jgi:hypothetical protein
VRISNKHTITDGEEANRLAEALAFAHSKGPIDVRAMARIRRECLIEWPPREYTLHAPLSVVPTDPWMWLQLWGYRKPRKKYGKAAEAEAKKIEAVRDYFKKELKNLAEAVAERAEPFGRFDYDLNKVMTLVQMIHLDRKDRYLPAEVLVAYAIALLQHPKLPWRKHMRICKFCDEAFLPENTGGRRHDYHAECHRPAHNAYMTSERRKGKSTK